MGTTTPADAASGAAIRLVLSPTPPVECLSTFTPGTEDKSTVSPERSRQSVKADTSLSRHAREEHGHEKRRHLVVRNLAGGEPLNQAGDLFGGQLLAVSLALNQVDSSHSSKFF